VEAERCIFKRDQAENSLSLCAFFSHPLLASLVMGAPCAHHLSIIQAQYPGSANQNDFRVRANGILPIWRRPKPWPPVVSLEAEEPRSATGESIDDTSAVSRVIVASHDEELSTLQQNSSVLIDHSPKAVPANEEKQTETNNSISSERADTASSKEP
jgi:hypothetical protein